MFLRMRRPSRRSVLILLISFAGCASGFLAPAPASRNLPQLQRGRLRGVQMHPPDPLCGRGLSGPTSTPSHPGTSLTGASTTYSRSPRRSVARLGVSGVAEREEVAGAAGGKEETMAERYLRESNRSRRLDSHSPCPVLVLDISDTIDAGDVTGFAQWMEEAGGEAVEFRSGDRAILASVAGAGTSRCADLVQDLTLSARVTAAGGASQPHSAESASLSIRIFNGDSATIKKISTLFPDVASVTLAAPGEHPAGALLAKVHFCAPRRAQRIRRKVGEWFARTRWAAGLALRVLASPPAARCVPHPSLGRAVLLIATPPVQIRKTSPIAFLYLGRGFPGLVRGKQGLLNRQTRPLRARGQDETRRDFGACLRLQGSSHLPLP